MKDTTRGTRVRAEIQTRRINGDYCEIVKRISEMNWERKQKYKTFHENKVFIHIKPCVYMYKTYLAYF